MREDRESPRRPLSPRHHGAPVEQRDHNQQLPAANKSAYGGHARKKGRTERKGGWAGGGKKEEGFFR